MDGAGSSDWTTLVVPTAAKVFSETEVWSLADGRPGIASRSFNDNELVWCYPTSGTTGTATGDWRSVVLVSEGVRGLSFTVVGGLPMVAWRGTGGSGEVTSVVAASTVDGSSEADWTNTEWATNSHSGSLAIVAVGDKAGVFVAGRAGVSV